MTSRQARRHDRLVHRAQRGCPVRFAIVSQISEMFSVFFFPIRPPEFVSYGG